MCCCFFIIIGRRSLCLCFRRKWQSCVAIGIGIVVAVVVTPALLPDRSLIAIVGLDVFLFDVTVFTVWASTVVRNIETDEFFERIRSQPAPVIYK